MLLLLAGLFNGRPVALKLLIRVKEEVQITAAVQHDNVVATYCCLQLDKGSLMATGKVSKGGGRIWTGKVRKAGGGLYLDGVGFLGGCKGTCTACIGPVAGELGGTCQLLLFHVVYYLVC